MKARLLAAAIVLLVFGAGLLAGILLERRHPQEFQVSVAPVQDHQATLAELRQVLDLDDAQMDQINAILIERQEVVDQMWEQFRPEVQKAMLQVHTEIADLLRPEQRQHFHEWLQNRRAAHDAMSPSQQER